MADDPDAAERVDITSTPTVIVRDSHGKQTFRGEGVPNINQVLAATVAALDA